MPFPSLEEYEEFIYTIPERFPSVQTSTLVLVRLGCAVGEVRGHLFFENDISLGISEEISFTTGRITAYSYWVSRGAERLYWYDSQPHPDDPTLASTHPHHKHVSPDIKHHRIPAPHLGFTEPNLPFLIREIEETILNPIRRTRL